MVDHRYVAEQIGFQCDRQVLHVHSLYWGAAWNRGQVSSRGLRATVNRFGQPSAGATPALPTSEPNILAFVNAAIAEANHEAAKTAGDIAKAHSSKWQRMLKRTMENYNG